MSDGWKRPDEGKRPDHVYPCGVAVPAAVQSHSVCPPTTATTVADVTISVVRYLKLERR